MKSNEQSLFEKAIFKDANSYYRADLTLNTLIPPIMEKVEGEMKDYTEKLGSTLPTYDDMVRASAERYVDPAHQEEYVKTLISSNLIEVFEAGASIPEYTCRIHFPHLDWHYRKYVAYLSEDAENGHIMAYIVAYDVTEQYEAEQRIKELESDRSVISVISTMADDFDYISATDLDTGEITRFRATDKCLRVIDPIDTSLPTNERMKIFLHTIVHPDDWEEFEAKTKPEVIIGELEKSPVYKFETRTLTLKDKKLEWYRFKFAYLADNKRIIVMGILNITEQMLREQETAALKVSAQEEAKFRKRIEQEVQVIRGLASDCVSLYTADLDNNTYKVYSITNEVDDIKTVVEGYSNLPKALRDYADGYVHPDDREKIYYYADLDNMREELRNSRSVKTTVRRNIDGEWVWIEMNMIKVGAVDRPAENVILAFTNRTEEVKKEQAYRDQLESALALAQAANKAKSTFLNNMSHDIRTPMNSIVGYTGLAASHIDDKEQVQTYLGKIMNSSNHLLSLINDVLDMARIESGKMNLTETTESLPEILHALHDIVLSDVNAKQLDFYVDTVNVKDENIICDRTRLNQVLLNILSNAVKYTPAGGTVTLRIAETAVSHSGYGTYEFRIKDSGVGMSKEELSHIFMPFERAASADENQIVGTGLGMSIVKNIVDMMGGHIEIQSEEGKGTEVTISFEFKLEEGNTEPDEISELKGARGIVVDDDMNACKSISRMLKTIGMRSDWCTSGKECIFRTEDAVQDGDNYRVYLIDWLMPDMNGIETTRRIRRLVGDDVPIVILTAYDYSDIEEEAREAGVTAFISKPLFQSDLAKTLRELCVAEEEPEPVEISYDFSGKKILIVEDNEDNLDIAEKLLTEMGVIVSSAVNGKIAVEVMSDATPEDFDLILMDIRMPVMNGLEAAKAIRAMSNGVQDIPILALTANAFQEDKLLAIEAGMNEHITKPLNVDKLKESLAKYL